MEDFWYETEMEWRKLPEWNMEKSSSIPFHSGKNWELEVNY